MHIPLWPLQSLYSSLSLPGNCITGFSAARGCPGKHSHPSGFSSEPHPPLKQGIAGRLCKKTSVFPLKTASRRRRSGGGVAPGREWLTPGPGSSYSRGASSPPASEMCRTIWGHLADPAKDGPEQATALCLRCQCTCTWNQPTCSTNGYSS